MTTKRPTRANKPATTTEDYNTLSLLEKQTERILDKLEILSEKTAKIETLSASMDGFVKLNNAKFDSIEAKLSSTDNYAKNQFAAIQTALKMYAENEQNLKLTVEKKIVEFDQRLENADPSKKFDELRRHFDNEIINIKLDGEKKHNRLQVLENVYLQAQGAKKLAGVMWGGLGIVVGMILLAVLRLTFGGSVNP